MPRTGIIIGSTRPGRKAEPVGQWVLAEATPRGNAEYEFVDLADRTLPILGEPRPPSFGDYQHAHTKRWADTIATFDGFVIVTPEYNHSMSAVLKNAFDYLFAEWNNKAIGFVSYGAHGGVRAVEHLRTISGELMMADARAQVALTLAGDFKNFQEFSPSEHQSTTLTAMLDQLVSWSDALAPLRAHQQ